MKYLSGGLLAVILLGSVAMMTSCSKKEKTVAGAVIGAGAGVGVGSALGGTGGAVAGGLLGTVTGGLIGNSMGDDKEEKK
jgi:uncharacterized protein YcfJ